MSFQDQKIPTEQQQVQVRHLDRSVTQEHTDSTALQTYNSSTASLTLSNPLRGKGQNQQLQGLLPTTFTSRWVLGLLRGTEHGRAHC